SRRLVVGDRNKDLRAHSVAPNSSRQRDGAACLLDHETTHASYASRPPRRPPVRNLVEGDLLRRAPGPRHVGRLLHDHLRRGLRLGTGETVEPANARIVGTAHRSRYLLPPLPRPFAGSTRARRHTGWRLEASAVVDVRTDR